MQRSVLASVGLFILALTGATARATDLPPPPILTKAPPLVALYGWTGCYLGGHVGGAWGDTDFASRPTPLATQTQTQTTTRTQTTTQTQQVPAAGVDDDRDHDHHADKNRVNDRYLGKDHDRDRFGDKDHEDDEYINKNRVHDRYADKDRDGYGQDRYRDNDHDHGHDGYLSKDHVHDRYANNDRDGYGQDRYRRNDHDRDRYLAKDHVHDRYADNDRDRDAYRDHDHEHHPDQPPQPGTTTTTTTSVITTTQTVATGLIGSAFNDDSAGILGGGQVGCNYQLNPNWVVGVEGDFSVAGISGDTADPSLIGRTFGTLHADTTWLAAVTGRVGYAFDRLLLFIRGGAAWAHQTYDYSGLAGVPFDFTGSDTRGGWIAGAGVEWAFLTHWSAKVGYDYYDFGTRTVSLAGPIAAMPVNITHRVQAVTVGLNYLF